jgi:hypothetical protein
LRKLLLALAAAAVVGSLAVPASAEQVDIGVTVDNNFGAVAYGTSTKAGETFGAFQIVRISATDSLADPHAVVAGASVAPIAGATTGTATFVVNAHPINGTEPSAFFFTSVVVCTKVGGQVSCLPGVGEHTVISALTGP